MSEHGRTYSYNEISAGEMCIILNWSRQQVSVEKVFCVGADHRDITYLYKHVSEILCGF